ncbi:MAG: polyprenyl synthetase family protein [Limisphaerales bacterium]
MNQHVASLLGRVQTRLLRVTARNPVLRQLSNHHFAAPGRMWRAGLGLEASAALGLRENSAICIAVASELIHNASLVQDDWMDGDRERRGQQALWTVAGDASAVLYADYLLMAAMAELAAVDVSAGQRQLLIRLTSRRVENAVAGQLREVQLRSCPIGTAEYLGITAAKTGAILSLPVELALAVAGEWRRHGRAVRKGLELLGLQALERM